MTEDQLFMRLKYSPEEVYDIFGEWWKTMVERYNHVYTPSRKEADKFLEPYGWDMVSLVLTVDTTRTEDMLVK